MAGAAKATVNHDTIRHWAEQRNGTPACVKGTGGRNDPGILRIDFPGFSGEETLQAIEWDAWFKAFEDNNLAFLHQDTIDGKESRFFKLVSRDSVEVEDEAPAAPQKARQRRRPHQ